MLLKLRVPHSRISQVGLSILLATGNTRNIY